MQIPGFICRFVLGFCKNIKKRTETLYQSFSPFMVEHRGFEPLTSTMRTLRATNCANAPWSDGWKGFFPLATYTVYYLSAEMSSTFFPAVGKKHVNPHAERPAGLTSARGCAIMGCIWSKAGGEP